MRIAIIGAGGIGAIYGAALARSGVEVAFVARGAHLAAMRANGPPHRGRPRRDADPPGPGDRRYREHRRRSITCCSASNCGMSRAPARSFGPFIGPDTAVVPVQNGVDAHERLIPLLGREAVMGGTAFVTGSIVAPGVVRQTGTYSSMTFGELDRATSPRGERLRDLCAAAGFDGVLSPDMLVPLWEKFIVLVPLATSTR